MKKSLLVLTVFVLLVSKIYTQQLNLDTVIERSARAVEEVLPQGTKVAVLNFVSTSETFSDHVIEELTGKLVMGRKITIVDRRNLALLNQEMKLQLSGDVSDESAQAIGRMLGAQSIISGTLTNMGTFYRFRVRVINVETAAIQTQVSFDLRNDEQVAFLMGINPTNSLSTSTQTATSAGQSALLQHGQLIDGIYKFHPRIRVNQAGVDKNLYLDRIVVRGQYFTMFFTGAPTGRGGDGDYGNFWNNHNTIMLQDLDRLGQPHNPISQGTDRDPTNPDRTDGFYLMFQGVTGTRFNLTGTRVHPPWVFDEIILKEPVAGSGGVQTMQQTSGQTRRQLTQLIDGTYKFYPRVRVNQAGLEKNLYLDRIVVHGQYFTMFFTGAPTGRGGDGDYGNFWNNHNTIMLQDLDRLGQPHNPISQGTDRDPTNPDRTDGFYLMFQGVTGTRFNLTGTRVHPPWVFDEIIIRE